MTKTSKITVSIISVQVSRIMQYQSANGSAKFAEIKPNKMQAQDWGKNEIDNIYLNTLK